MAKKILAHARGRRPSQRPGQGYSSFARRSCSDPRGLHDLRMSEPMRSSLLTQGVSRGGRRDPQILPLRSGHCGRPELLSSGEPTLDGRHRGRGERGRWTSRVWPGSRRAVPETAVGDRFGGGFARVLLGSTTSVNQRRDQGTRKARFDARIGARKGGESDTARGAAVVHQTSLISTYVRDVGDRLRASVRTCRWRRASPHGAQPASDGFLRPSRLRLQPSL